MAKLSITVRDDCKHLVDNGSILSPRCYRILVDDREISHLTDALVKWAWDGVPIATLSFRVSELEVDAMALMALEATVKAQEEAR